MAASSAVERISGSRPCVTMNSLTPGDAAASVIASRKGLRRCIGVRVGIGVTAFGQSQLAQIGVRDGQVLGELLVLRGAQRFLQTLARNIKMPARNLQQADALTYAQCASAVFALLVRGLCLLSFR